MKKQLIALGLASILTVPSVVLAEATWYGSFRGIVHSQGGETSMMSNGSRWGVKGSSEVSEGLTAVYRYEENLNLANATLGAGNRLSSVGLSGGFGTVTLGQIWSASYNHVGVLTDNGVWSGNQSQTGRTGSALSYSASSGPVSFQIDANMNGGTGRSVDMAQLGMSFDTGAAKVGLAVITAESAKDSTRQSSIGVSVPVGGLTLYSSWSEKEVTTFATPGSDAVVIPGSDPVTIPGSDPVTIPGSDPVTIPGSDPVTIPAQAAINIAERTEITVPAQVAVNIPAREIITVPGSAAVQAVAGTPDRCLIVRYANASFGEKQETDTETGRDLYWTSPPPTIDGADRPTSDTKSAQPSDWPVIVEDKNKVERNLDLAGENYTTTTGGDVRVVRYTNENIESVFDTKTGLTKYSCGENTKDTGNDANGPYEYIAARIYQPAVSNVVGIEPGEREEAAPARDRIYIPARGPEVSGTVKVVLTPADPATLEKTVKTRHMHAGVSGPLGDTGMSFAVNVANHPDSKDGIGENPWNFNVSKSLGGGASLAFEYVDYDEFDDNEALLRLKVDF